MIDRFENIIDKITETIFTGILFSVLAITMFEIITLSFF